MENFVVSARKYRPATFDSVVGQPHITTTLKNAIKNNHLAQSFLFCGPRGVGKTTSARILAKTINCENITPEVEACNHCTSCVSFNENSSFNIHELDAASNNSVDDIRNLVDQVRYPPQGTSKYKIYIIDEVHMLSNQAFNAFLKTLEEPPRYAIFILATTEKHKIIPTILSRCQIFDFNRIQIKDISMHLASIAQKEKIKAEPQALHLIAQKADGALRDALSIFDLIVTFSSNNTVTYKNTIDNLHILDYDYYFKMTDALCDQNISSALVLYDEVLRKGFDGHNFIVGLNEHFRNLLVCKDVETIKLLEVAEEVKLQYRSQSESATISFLMSALSIGNACDLNFKSSKNHRIHVELTLLKMAFLNSVLDVSIIAEPELEKKKPDNQSLASEKSTKKLPEEGVVASVELTEEPAPETITHIEKALETPPAPKTGFKSTLNLASLKNLKHTISQPPADKEVEAAPQPKREDKAFNFEDLQKYWKLFSDNFKKEGKASQYVVLDRPLTLDGTCIHVNLDNLIQLDQLNIFKHDLLEFLRNKLHNYSISLVTEIAPDSGIKKAYTSKEKFNEMVKKNPLLEDLKNKLGLETDF